MRESYLTYREQGFSLLYSQKENQTYQLNSKRMIKNVRQFFILSSVVMSMFAMMACGSSTETSEDAGDEKVLVKTERVAVQQVEQRDQFTGNVEPFEKAYISPATPSRVSRIYKEVGDAVRKGELLVQMDASNYRQAKAQLDILEREFARLDTLYKVGSVSQQQLDQLATELEVTRTAFENLQENTQLRSPINGVVTGRFFENGEMFSGSPVVDNRAAILTVEQINPVKVTVNVSEQHFPRVDKDLNVSLALDVYPGKTFDGSVHLKYPTIDPVTRTFTVELQFPNRDQVIRPGMFGRVTLGFGEFERVVAPDLAVLRQQGTSERFVFVVENGKAVRKTVRVGRRIGDTYEIISGLTDGEEVVTAGHSRLLDGTSVRFE
ncbi:RND family efflux transporter MFP subunit [Natronoflexus pectinivorans]|uniref:RND family efflux transporter MFP subunit n=2 Tax=Natronoflexus pectinivorans TaxID=682526 RepID=A0A4R2GQ02_9BACT|nr:RND family efflux transporter MFP subunit [Natronoflexus pectinivorans]